MLTHNITLYMKTSIVLKVIEKYNNALENVSCTLSLFFKII